MAVADEDQAELALRVENVGGIDETAVEMTPGVTVLTGRNATNRTSLLRALMAGMGSDDVSLKGDAEEGRVELTIGGETYERTLERTPNGVQFGGDPYLDDTTAVDLFAFLLETNEARQAVAQERNLRDLIMRPVDTAEIEAEIRRVERERDELDTEIERRETLRDRLPALESERTRLREEIEETEAERERVETQIEEHDSDPAAQREQQSEFEEQMERLREARADLDDVRHEIDTQRQSLEALEAQRADLEADYEESDASDQQSLEELKRELDRRRREKSDIESELNQLQSVIDFNQQLLADRDDGFRAALSEELTTSPESRPVTEQLTESQDVVCWTCGSQVTRDGVEATLDQLRSFRNERRSRRRELAETIDELESDVSTVERERRERRELERELDQVRREIEDRRDQLEELREEKTRRENRVEEIESAVETLDSGDDELLELHREANELEFELGSLRSELEDVRAEIDDIEDQLAELSELRTQRERLATRLTDLRTRVTQREQTAVESFNHHMEELLELLDYDNIERIWIERVGTDSPGDDGAADQFELHVVRSTDDGVSYEDSVKHLSESEREVTGLVFALAGYLVYDLGDRVSVVLLDSVEAIDRDRIVTLVEYLADHAEYLVVALLPEDASALPESHARITEI
jgi:DNA repair exonuclease SbcCD ATPase subunit